MNKSALILKDADGTIRFDYSRYNIKNNELFLHNLKKALNSQIIYDLILFVNLDNPKVHESLTEYFELASRDVDAKTFSNATFDYIEPDYYYTTTQRQELIKIYNYFCELVVHNRDSILKNDKYELSPEWALLKEMSANFLYSIDGGWELADQKSIDHFIDSYLSHFSAEIEEQLAQIIREHPDWEKVWVALLELEKKFTDKATMLAKEIVLRSLKTPIQKSLAWQIWVKHDKEYALDWLKNCGHKINPELLKLIQGQ